MLAFLLYWIYLLMEARVYPANWCHLQEFHTTTYVVCKGVGRFQANKMIEICNDLVFVLKQVCRNKFTIVI